MQPLLSIIVPTHNHTRTLPRLFDSLLIQKMQNFEVILVDDCSDIPCDDIVAAYSNKGLTISPIPLATRHYQSARFVGMEAARADIIGFADADDILWGTDALKTHVELFTRTQPDILHFRAVHTDEYGNFTCYPHWLDPLAPELTGDNIFIRHTQAKNGHTLWNKYFSRRLCEEVLPIARQHSIKRRAGDAHLLTLLLIHARSYRASDLVGYGYHYFDKKFDPFAFDYAKALSEMVEEIAPLLRQKGFAEEIIGQFADYLYSKLSVYVGRFCRNLLAGSDHTIPTDAVAGLLQIFSPEELIKSLILSNGYNAYKLTRMYHGMFSANPWEPSNT